jgi:hypothetical protein
VPPPLLLLLLLLMLLLACCCPQSLLVRSDTYDDLMPHQSDLAPAVPLATATAHLTRLADTLACQLSEVIAAAQAAGGDLDLPGLGEAGLEGSGRLPASHWAGLDEALRLLRKGSNLAGK